jgi:hypothetical protein
LGAVVEGYDVRPDTEGQAESLGATFGDTGVDATRTGGYARALSGAEKTHVAAVLSEHIRHADLIVTTAAIPGHPSPKPISHAQVTGMKAGAVIVDLSAEGGGNCEDTRPGETTQIGLVTIVAPLNVASLIGEDASALYAKNLYNLLGLMLKDNVLVLDWNAKPPDAVEAVRKGTNGGAHGVLMTAPSLSAFKQGVGMTRKRGTCVLVGLPPGDFPVPLFDVVAYCITIRGSFVGNGEDMVKTLAFAAAGTVKADIELQPLSAINDVFGRLEEGKVAGRIVLDFEGAANHAAHAETYRAASPSPALA